MPYVPVVFQNFRYAILIVFYNSFLAVYIHQSLYCSVHPFEWQRVKRIILKFWHVRDWLSTRAFCVFVCQFPSLPKPLLPPFCCWVICLSVACKLFAPTRPPFHRCHSAVWLCLLFFAFCSCCLGNCGSVVLKNQLKHKAYTCLP